MPFAKFTVKFLKPQNVAIPAQLLGALTRGLRHVTATHRVTKELRNRVGYRLWIPRWNQQPAFRPLNDSSSAADRRRDHRAAFIQGLDQHNSKRLCAQAGEYKEVHCRHHAEHVTVREPTVKSH